MRHLLQPSAPIGIFDSGLGGLSVLKEIEKLLPYEDVLFVGDTARQPYGPRSIEEVRRYTLEITAFLVSKGAKAVIIACNTASIAGREAAQAAFPQTPVFGMISAGVRGALRATEQQRVAVWGTAITIQSHAHHDLLKKEYPNISVQGVACPDLLRLAEKGKIDDTPLLLSLVQKYYQPLLDFEPDTLILGCTDFTCVRHIIDQVVPGYVNVIDPAEEVASSTRSYLQEKNLFNPNKGHPGQYTYFVTGEDIDNFTSFARRFMGRAEINVNPLPVEELTRLSA
jgi:glutamate racemase